MRDIGEAGAIRNYSFLKIFADSNGLDAAELGFIERLALRDGKVDDHERAALTAIFAKAECIGMSPEVAAEVASFKKLYQIG